MRARIVLVAVHLVAGSEVSGVRKVGEVGVAIEEFRALSYLVIKFAQQFGLAERSIEEAGGGSEWRRQGYGRLQIVERTLAVRKEEKLVSNNPPAEGSSVLVPLVRGVTKT